MPESPASAVFIFTDLEDSTQLWEEHPRAMSRALARHDDLLRRTLERHGGRVFKSVGDGFCAVFESADRAVAAAVEAQRRLSREAWKGLAPLRARMALHAGPAERRSHDYFGPTLNRTARILAAGHGGQILLSAAVERLARPGLPADVALRDCGEVQLKDLSRPERLFQLVIV
ncbi:MAG: adenylate/guanylate cyclase domain-containing protein, partial [Gemmatimonadota bacterium]